MKKYDQQLDRLHAMKSEPVTPGLVAEVRKALGNKSNYMAGKAAGVVEHHRLAELTPDLLTAFGRFLKDAVKTDPQCWAKNAIIKTLSELGHDDPEVYRTGLKHLQLEPVWGGVEDTAGTLRSLCAHALVQCRSLSDPALFSLLLPTLVDKVKTVRVEGARAIASTGRGEASLLLRLKALTGDEEPEVTGACLSAVLSIERESGLDFVRPFLEATQGELVAEAALALGLARLPDAVPMLIARYRQERDRTLASVLLTALAVSQHPAAAGFLLEIIESDAADRAIAAIGAMASARMPSAEVHDAALRNSDPTVEAACRQSFLPPLSSA